MNHRKFIVIGLIVALTQSLFSQNKNIEMYFSKLNDSLKSLPNIKDVKCFQQMYGNKNIKNMAMFVKFKEDSLDRYWQVGKCYTYYRNGYLKVYHNIDLNELTDIDTTCYYDRKGKLKRQFVVLKTSNNKLPNIDTKYFKGKKDVQIILYNYDEKLISFKENSKSDFGAYYYKLPYKYLVLNYKDGKLNSKFAIIYNSKKAKYVLDSDITSYNNDGSVKEVLKYGLCETIDSSFIFSKSEINWDSLEYKGHNSYEIQNFIKENISNNKTANFTTVQFKKGNYTTSQDTISCKINAQINPYVFILANNNKTIKILTAKEIETYSVGGFSYVKYNEGDQYLFLEKLATGKLDLFLDLNLHYYIKSKDSDTVYIIIPNSKDIQSKPDSIEILNQRFKVQMLLKEEEIETYFLFLPEISESLKRKLKFGVYGVNNITQIINDYNSGN